MRSLFRRIYRFLLPRLFARHDFKLLLNASLGVLGERARLLTASTDYFQGVVRSVPISAPFGESMIVVAPHQDDEAIGCGAALAAQVRSGKKVRVVLLQDGADGHEQLGMSREQMRDMRNAESIAASATLGLPPPLFLNHPNLNTAGPAIITALRQLIIETRADVILSPFPLDAHPDHRTAAFLLADALRDVSWPVRVLTYEVWGLCIANVVFPFDPFLNDKRKMLEAFVWANQALDYTNTTLGLNQFRARQLPVGVCRHAECFFELPAADYVEFIDRLAVSPPS